MAYAVGVPQHRNAAYRLDLSDEFLGAPGNDEVDILIEGEEFAYFLAGFEEGEPVPRETCLFSGAGDYRREGLIALSRLASAFEHDGVSALYRERCHLHERVRAAFEDQCDEADRAANPPELKAFVKKACLKDFPDRIGHIEEVPNTRQHLLQLFSSKRRRFKSGGAKPSARAFSMSFRLASNIASRWDSSCCAICSSAAFLISVLTESSEEAACAARSSLSCIFMHRTI